jgi:hypothetical protein
MREFRKTHPMSPEQRERHYARTYARVYRLRGKIAKEPCVLCGSDRSQMHHPDYKRPTYIVWFCRQCHELIHKIQGFKK